MLTSAGAGRILCFERCNPSKHFLKVFTILKQIMKGLIILKLYTLENDVISVVINSIGAELYSIKTKADGCEYLWQGDPEYWSGRSYNLFPICGRLTEGKYTYNGKTYEMNLHGFARDSEFSLIKREAGELSFELISDESTKAVYPFDFRYVVSYILDGGRLRTVYDVYNSGNGELIFALGGHPGFMVPLNSGDCFEDYRLEFSKPTYGVKKLAMSETCYTLPDYEDFPLENGYIIPLRHNMFDHDAIFLSETSGEVTLKSKNGGKSVCVSYPDMKYIGFWHKPYTEAPFVCIEPWTSVPAYDSVIDKLETKRDMIHLKSGEIKRAEFIIEIK